MDTKLVLTTKDELESLILTSVKRAIAAHETNNYQEPPEQDQIFSIKEAAAYLNLARQTLYGFTSKREIPFIKKGKKLYFKRSELENWLLEGKRKTKAEIEAEIRQGKRGGHHG